MAEGLARNNSTQGNSSLGRNNYGKQHVRLVHVDRSSDWHELRDLTVGVRMEGDFETAHVSGDNSQILTTDTMKNTVYALAAEGGVGPVEDFARRLTTHFLRGNPQIWRVSVEVVETGWSRLAPDGAPHPHAFYATGAEEQTAVVTASRDQVLTQVGLRGLTILKTTNSKFIGYVKDRYTTLPETMDRIFKTVLEASWSYLPPEVPWATLRTGVRRTLLDIFADHDSLSVQQTLYAMGDAVLNQYADVAEISLSLPNRHCIPFNLEPLGLENKNEVFVATEEPFGLIEATVRRG